MAVWDTIKKGAATLGGTAYDYLTPGLGSSRLTDYGAGLKDKKPVTTPPNYGKPSPAPTSTPTNTDDYIKELQAALRAAQTPIPRLADFDIASSWDRARTMAEQAVSPIYQQKMTDYINKEYTKNIERANADAISNKSALDLALERMLQDTQLTRTRTGEDAATATEDINAAQDYAAREGGLGFDAAYRAFNEQLGTTGMAGSGLGAQQTAETQRAYRDMSNEQVRQSENKVEAVSTLMNRTFQDLDIKEERGRTDTASAKTKVDLDLERFIQDEEDRLDTFRKDQELAKQMEIADRSSGLQGQLVDEWIASLRGKGYNPQEVALAASIYR